MREIIETYYKALLEKDTKLLKTVLSDDIFGVRTFKENILFINEELLAYCEINTIQKVDIISYIEQEQAVKLRLNLKDEKTHTINVKIELKNNKIYKVYEVVETDKLRYKATIAYEGTDFYGYQRQAQQISIQETIETCIKCAFNLKEDVQIHSSGRTDKGVHANNQVIHFDCLTPIPTARMKDLLNSYLPDSIYIKNLSQVDKTFHSRYDVKTKQYLYKISFEEFDPLKRNFVWFTKPFDIVKYENALAEIKGTHDFTSFTKTTDKDTVRTIFEVEVIEEEHVIYTRITGNGFLRYMVRNIIGAAVNIASNKESYSIKELLEKKDVTLLKDKAPAQGLYLNQVNY